MERENVNDDSMDVDNPTHTLAPIGDQTDLALAGNQATAAPVLQPDSTLSELQLSVPAAPSQQAVLPTSNSISGLPGYTVGYVFAVEMLIHFKKDGHPEQPQRIRQILDMLAANSLTPLMKQLPIRQVKKHEAMLVHSEDHWDKVVQIQCERLVSLSRE